MCFDILYSHCVKKTKPKLTSSSSNCIDLVWFNELNWWCKHFTFTPNTLSLSGVNPFAFFSHSLSLSVCFCLPLSQFNFSVWIAALARLLTRRNAAKVVLRNVKCLPASLSIPLSPFLLPLLFTPCQLPPPSSPPPAVPSWRQRCVAALCS